MSPFSEDVELFENRFARDRSGCYCLECRSKWCNAPRLKGGEWYGRDGSVANSMASVRSTLNCRYGPVMTPDLFCFFGLVYLIALSARRSVRYVHIYPYISRLFELSNNFVRMHCLGYCPKSNVASISLCCVLEPCPHVESPATHLPAEWNIATTNRILTVGSGPCRAKTTTQTKH